MKSNLSRVEQSEKRHFDKIAEKYDTNYQYSKPFTKYKIAKKSKDFAKIVKSTYKSRALEMLEIGCGTGEYTKQVARLFPQSRVVALDISEKVIEIARRKCKKFRNTSFLVRGAYDTGLKSNSLDLIYGFYVLHHLEIDRVKKEMLRILKPGGLVFFYEPNILNPVVFIIKTNRFLEKIVGDSPNETAINPLTVKRHLKGFRIVNISTTEFIWPLSFLSKNILIKIDKASQVLSYVPVVKYLGGSVQILLQKG